MKCQFNQDGKECNSNAMKTSIYCFSHNPEAHEAKIQAVTKGGLAKKQDELLLLDPIELKTSEQVASLLENTINRIRKVSQNGEMPIKVASTIGFLATHLLKAIESSDLDDRLEVVESVILQRRIQERKTKWQKK
jgi:hypothetical protein